MNVELLLAPIAGDHPGGEDLTFALELDTIREARRADDSSLDQGEWATSVKQAQWPKVRELTESLLGSRSKDLQVACWYAEAMVRLQGFDGARSGFQVLSGLVTDFWEFLYPELDPADPESLEERVGKLEWLNRELPLVLRQVAITSPASGGYHWLQWEESRRVENLGLKDADARQQAVAEGKMSGEQFDKAVKASGVGFYQGLLLSVQSALTALADLEQGVDRSFGQQAPSLRGIRESLEQIAQQVERFLRQLGGVPTGEATSRHTLPSATPAASSAASMAVTAVPHLPVMVEGPITSRAQAVTQLRAVAAYFRQAEPHSPVTYLAERAANWADMPLDQWLGSVIKDEGTLLQMRELLGVKPPAEYQE